MTTLTMNFAYWRNSTTTASTIRANISEIRAALVDEGMMDKNRTTRVLKLKDEFKRDRLLQVRCRLAQQARCQELSVRSVF